MKHAIVENGLCIVRTEKGIGVCWDGLPRILDRPLRIDVYHGGRRLFDRTVDPLADLPWRDYFPGYDLLKCWIRVWDSNCGTHPLAELSMPAWEFVHPWMVCSIGPQQHITENYISVPPALHITDEMGAVFSLGVAYETANPDQGVKGESNFQVLRDGLPTGTIASRLDRRGGKIRAHTRQGTLTWGRFGHGFL